MLTTHKFLKIILLIAIILLYIQTGFQIIANYPKEKNLGLIHRINQSTPAFNYLFDLSYQKTNVDQKQLLRFIKYYELLIEMKTADEDLNEIHEVLAFCYFYLGQYDIAINLYKEAIMANPDFFWSHYNLALCYLSKRDLPSAKASFELSLYTDPGDSINHMITSKTYLQHILHNNVTVHGLSTMIINGFKLSDHYVKVLDQYAAIQDPAEEEAYMNTLVQTAHALLF